ncbi:hypothetical protein ALC53_09928 [Atta colombica]|uniref:BMP and activin membrane-bound inhibitor like protein n=1 Tax=Atta colombica TaxID=520822 RepID=A0A195B5S2_9HYME|nr:hypothetical protein ALC53_09928 [Atta colombica]
MSWTPTANGERGRQFARLARKERASERENGDRQGIAAGLLARNWWRKTRSQGEPDLRWSCFTKLPSNANALFSRAEHTAHSGCFDENLMNRQCPAGFLCCDQDLCNHVDSPAMRNRLNKTLRVLIDDQRPYLAPLHPNSRGNQAIDGWFPTATIIVAICGFIVLLMIASLAVRWLQPMPAQNANKFVPHRTSNNGPPLLGPPKVPLV